MSKITIAIDGYSSCGKSTIAKDLAKMLGYIYVDTGAMYRAFTLYCLNNKLITEDGDQVYKIEEFLDDIDINFKCDVDTGKCEVYLNGENVEDQIRNLRIASNVSKISGIKEVRAKLTKIQRELGGKKGVVMDGRDIGTVVFPDAELKLFVTADTDVRSRRRYNELKGRGDVISFEEVKENLEKRDYYDTHREESPLVRAEDAIIIDTTHHTRSTQLNEVIELAAEKMLEVQETA